MLYKERLQVSSKIKFIMKSKAMAPFSHKEHVND